MGRGKIKFRVSNYLLKIGMKVSKVEVKNKRDMLLKIYKMVLSEFS